MVENIIVAILVALAALYACGKYLPVRWRRRIVQRLARDGAAHTKLARWFGTESGCASGCDKCGSCAEPASADQPEPRVIKVHARH